jgi:ATP-dependent Lon protease
MEVLHLSSYLETEKMHIGRQFLLPKQWEMHGIGEDNLRISDNALLEIIRSYTRESGVRSLEREIAALCRKTAIRMVDGEDAVKTVTVTRQNLHTFLGVKKYRYGEREDQPQVGVVVGLAFNDRGGEILYVETVLMPGTGKISITGQLGDVMTESAQAAFSYIRSRADMFDLKPDFHKELDVHVHVPEGATPKDGPSAGITMATSIASALLGIPVRNDVAMTGEITLRGRVLPIGGLREKLLAARRAGVHTVLLPADNEKDLKEVPDEVLKSLRLIFVRHVDEVLPVAMATSQEEIFPRHPDTRSFVCNLRRQQEIPSPSPAQ